MAYGSGLTRGAQLLTHRSIEALRSAEAPYRVTDQRCKGLAVRVAPSGVKTWDLAYRIRGTAKTRRLSLGRTTDVSLEQARERANELTGAARQGRDLIGEEGGDAAASRITVEKLIDLYLRRRVICRLRTAKAIERGLRRDLAPIAQRCAADVSRRDLRELLDTIAERGCMREAEKRRQMVGTMFRWGLGQDIVAVNPAGGLEPYDPGVPRTRVLGIEEIETLWRWLDSGSLSTDAAAILKLALLTAARVGEICGICAEEIDRRKWIWTLPAARSKSKKPRLTPLLGTARELIEPRLEGVEAGSLFLLEKGVTLNPSHIGHYLLTRRTTLPIAVFTSHDLRRSAATHMVEMGIALDVVARVLGHESVAQDIRILRRHYVHTDLLERKAHALRMWDERVKAIVAGGEAAKVVNLPRAIATA
jgi:integrase